MEKKKNVIDVTIIVPVYNVEHYLRKCLDSLVNQDYDNKKYEILIVNDASTDKSINVIYEYHKQYSNISVYDLKKNGGVSNARNIGIENAKGQYLMFCDADDYYDTNAISIMMSYVKKEKADFIMANYYITNGINKISVDVSGYFSNMIISREEIVSYMTLTSSAKLIKKDLFINNNISYPTDLKRCEELSVIPIVAYFANKAVVIKDTLYYYYQRSDSVSNTNSKKTPIGDLDYFDKSFERFVANIDSLKYSQEIEFRAIDHLLYGKSLVMLKSGVQRKYIVNHINDFKRKYCKFTRNIYFKKYNIGKKIFVYSLNCKLLFVSKLLAYIHGKLTG